MAAPLKIGILRDQPPPAPGTTLPDVLATAIQLAATELGGRLDAEIELIEEQGEGLPGGTAWAVERAYAALADHGVLAIVGPAIGDNALVATPLADQWRIPTINWAGTERARSEWMFHLQVGSHEDEGLLLARYLGGEGITRVGVIFDRSPIGRRYLSFFEEECERLGVSVTARVGIDVLPDDATAEVAAVRASGADALVQLGLGFAALEVAKARTAAGWDVPRAGNTWGLRGYQPTFGKELDGWTYVDMLSDANTTLAHAKQALGVTTAAAGYAYDAGRLITEAIARAPERTREGVKRGLELVKMLPAAEGKEGTQLGFGHWERGALKGHYLVLRQWQGGSTIEL